MPAFEVQVRAKIGNQIDYLTEKYPSLKVWTWCNFQNDIHEISADNPTELEEALTEFKDYYHILEETPISDSVRLITQRCICSKETTLHDNIQELEILNLMPVYSSGGWNLYRFIAFKHEAFTELLRRGEEHGFTLEVLEMVPFNGMVSDNLIPLNSMISNLTEKQIEAVIAAYNNCYYQTPRSVKVQNIADRVQVPRTTLQEHLNKAENKLISALVPQIILHAHKNRG
jgi:predicted DNA binding protein